jgi:hypothetical protein
MKNEKFFCRNCRGLRNHKELFKVKKSGGDEDDFIHWMREYSVIECLGCETISFLEVYGDDTMVRLDSQGEPDFYEDKTVFPLYLEKSEELSHTHYIPDKIRYIYEETIYALKANSYLLTAGGFRATIEAICNHLRIKKGNLADRIDLLYNKSYLTSNESKRLHSIRFIGNDALHEIEKPTKDDLYILLEIINHLLANLFITDKILQGKMETVIDTYDEYLKLIQKKITHNVLGKELSISDILGKSIRLIHSKNSIKLEQQLIEEIRNNKIDYLSIVNETNEIIYKVEKIPEYFLQWF